MEKRIKKDKSKQTAVELLRKTIKYNARIRKCTLQANAIIARHQAKRARKKAMRAEVMEEPAVELVAIPATAE